MEILLLNQSTDVYTTFPLHTHGYWEIILNTFGTGMAEVGEERIPFGVGTILCIPPHLPHRKISDTGYTDSCIFLREVVPLTTSGFAVLEDDPFRTFGTLFQMAYEVQMRAEANASAIINALGDVMYQRLVGWSTGGQPRHEAVTRLQHAMLDNMDNPGFDLTREMAHTGYSPSHLRKLFREQLGHSPLDYLHHIRIEHAKRMLQQYHGMRTIKAIALSCGFSDPYYFSRLFRQLVGMSPEGYVAQLGAFSGEQIAVGGEKRFTVPGV